MRVFLLIACVYLAAGCRTDDDWKTPAALDVQIGLVDETLDHRQKIAISAASITIASVEVVGQHSNGEAVEFKRELSPAAVVDLSTQPAFPLRFDIPQGKYNALEVRLNTVETGGSNSLYMIGKFDYGNPSWREADVLFTVQNQPSFTFDLVAATGSFEISAGAGAAYSLLMQPSEWLKDVNPSIMRQADITLDDDKPYVPVNQRQNTQIYRKMQDRLGQNNQARQE